MFKLRNMKAPYTPMTASPPVRELFRSIVSIKLVKRGLHDAERPSVPRKGTGNAFSAFDRHLDLFGVLRILVPAHGREVQANVSVKSGRRGIVPLEQIAIRGLF